MLPGFSSLAFASCCSAARVALVFERRRSESCLPPGKPSTDRVACVTTPPTLAEAIAAAQGMTDDREQQVAFAADLIGADAADVRAELAKLQPDRRATLTMVAPSRDRGQRVVVVERKMSRRVASRDGAPRASRSLHAR